MIGPRSPMTLCRCLKVPVRLQTVAFSCLHRSSARLAGGRNSSTSVATRRELHVGLQMMMASSKETTWIGQAGAAGFDLRSDVTTTPTAAMLQAIQTCSLYDDVWQEDTDTNDLEAHCAFLTGKEAGLFVLSGTMGNQLALRSLLTQPPHSILCDHRSHIFKSEAGGVALLNSAMVYPVVPRNGIYLTVEDIEAAFVPEGNIVGCPTRLISLENTLYGTIMPLAEVQRIAAFARKHDLKMHCDGARLWEAAAAGAGSLRDFAACFDSVSLCFSKGLGAPVGSVLVGDTATVQRARHLRKAIGGGLRQPGVLTSAARVAVDETFGTGPSGEGGLLRATHLTARKVEALWKGLGGTVKYPVQTNVVWLNLVEAGISLSNFNTLGMHEGLKLKGERLVIHYQIYQNEQKVLERLERVMTKAWAGRGQTKGVSHDASASVY